MTQPLSIMSLTLCFTLCLALPSSWSGDSAQAQPIQEDRLTLIKLSVSPTQADKKPWDEDGSAPDLIVKIKADKKLIWVSPVQENQLELSWPTSIVIPKGAAVLKVFVHDHDADKAKPQLISGLKVSALQSILSEGVVQRSFSGKNIEKLTFKFEGHAPSKPKEVPKAQPAPSKKVTWAESTGDYQPLAAASVKTSMTPLTPLKPSSKGAQKLYDRYIQLFSKGKQIEAKYVLIELIQKHPKTPYGQKAKRLLF